MKRIVRLNIGAAEAGQYLLELLVQRFTYHSQREWEELIHEGHLLINNHAATVQQQLHRGDILEYQVSSHSEPPVDLKVVDIYEDDALLVLNKPPNLPCHPAGRYFNHTLWAMLKNRGLQKVHFVNRLDRETSGLIIIGKTAAAAKECRRQWASHRVVKKYNVLVEGEFPDSCKASGHLIAYTSGTIRKKLKFLPMAVWEHEPGHACTYFKTLQRIDGMSLLEAVPVTGRLHQIRATLHGLGFPVVGDKIYGIDETAFLRFIADGLSAEDKLRLRLDRQALHAMELEFYHPATHELLHLEAPLPADIKTLLCRGYQGL